MIDHPLPSPMEGLDVLLFDRLLWDEWDVGMPCRGAYRLGVVAVVLLPAHEGLHILRADDFYLMAERLELPCPAEGSGAGLNHNRASINLRDNLQKFLRGRADLQ